MRSPPLSPSQRAYLFRRETFLARLQERACRLFEDGYSVQATQTPYVFVILCPQRVNAYRVHALDQTCDCPFFARQLHDEPLTPDGSLVLCKHLRGLDTLLQRTRQRLLKEGDTCEVYRLWAHTMALRAVLRLRDDDAETTTAATQAVTTTSKGGAKR